MRRTRAGRGGWDIAMLWAISLTCATGVAWSETPELPRVSTVPPTDVPPLSSAERKGTEYADLAAAGYVEQELYLSGMAPAITAQGKILFNAPYITREPANLNLDFMRRFDYAR